MKTFLARHQISIFFLLAFVISWFPWYAGIAPEVMAMGPSLAAFILVILIGGKRGLLDLLRPFGGWRAGLGWWVIAIFGPAFLYLIGLGVHLLLGGAAPPFTMIRTELNLIPLYLFMVVLMPWNGPVGEEFGWRGFALPRLQNKYGALMASVIIGAIWGVWHLPTFYAPRRYFQHGIGHRHDFPSPLYPGDHRQLDLHDLAVQQNQPERTDCRDRLAHGHQFLGPGSVE